MNSRDQKDLLILGVFLLSYFTVDTLQRKLAYKSYSPPTLKQRYKWFLRRNVIHIANFICILTLILIFILVG